MKDGYYDDYITSIGTTIERFISIQEKRVGRFANAKGSLSQLLKDVVLASKIINREINRAGLSEAINLLEGTLNHQGEIPNRLDVIAHARFVRSLSNGRKVFAIISEEHKNIIYTENKKAKYIVYIDPLDGSSNIDVNVSLGTIFSIYRRIENGSEINKEEFLRCGNEQIAAGYVLYGSSTMLVYTTGHGVNGFTYEPSLGEYLLSHPNIKIKTTGNIYSINEGYTQYFKQQIKDYINYCHNQKYSARYIGSLVSDFHRNLLKGGIYLYPSLDDKYPKGKLRLMYESNALSMICEQAGGKATNGKERILDIKPESVHERSELYIGSAEMVDKLMEFLNSNN